MRCLGLISRVVLMVLLCGSNQAAALQTRIAIDLTAMTGTASIELAAGQDRVLSVDGIEVRSIRTTPHEVALEVSATQITVPAQAEPVTLEVVYRLSRGEKHGWLASGETITWPEHCGRLFPCIPNPAEGRLYTLAITGVPAGHLAIYPSNLDTPAPAYQLAWAVGPYIERSLGQTPAGTEVLTWYQAGDEQAVDSGTSRLVEIVGWLEANLGPYPYGSRVGAVVLPESSSGLAMEHHPFWHVPAGRKTPALYHAHEAAHGWFGNGVRIKCWEDFVLSEGTASYLAVKVIGVIYGPVVESNTWLGYHARMNAAARTEKGPVLRSTCGEVDVIAGKLFTPLTYMRGAFFLKAVEKRVGAEVLLQALSSFYRAHKGEAKRMTDLVKHIEVETSVSLSAEVEAWLLKE